MYKVQSWAAVENKYSDFIHIRVYVLDGTDAPFDAASVGDATIEQIFLRPQDFDGKSVVVTGELRKASKLHALRAAEEPRYLNINYNPHFHLPGNQIALEE